MSLPRPALIAIFGLVLVLATFFLTRGTAEPEVSPPASSSPPTASGERAPSAGPTAPTGSSSAAEPDASPERPVGAPASKPKEPAAKLGVPRRVQRAFARRKVVVIFVTQRVSADDVATRRAFRRLRKRRDTAVFATPLRRLERYGPAVSRLGVSQTPAILVIGRNRKAKLLEGYLDSGSLRQAVADAREGRARTGDS